MSKLVKIGTRGSKLAVWQAEWVRSELLRLHQEYQFDLVRIRTKGDKITDVPLARVGGKGLFVKEIEEALLSCQIDMAVHSMKDMPVEIPEGLCIGAVPRREDPRDALIAKGALSFHELPRGARIGTSSLRRSAQLLHFRPDLIIQPLRGNLDTRLKKLLAEELDAIVVAAAGIKRLSLTERVTEYLSIDIMLPAIGQGALGIEIRQDDEAISKLVSDVDHLPSRIAVMGERSFLKRLEGGCQVPIAALGNIEGDTVTLSGLIADIDGTRVMRETITGPKDRADELGVELAEELIKKGAKEILYSLHS
nr:hydroxymethylbilane synthase [Desulfobacterales bacterium]